MEIEPQRPTPEPQRRGPTSVPRPSLDRLFLHQRGQITWDQVANFRSGPKRRGHKLMLWSWLAIMIDGLVLLSFSSTFVLAFALMMRMTSLHHLGFNAVKLFAVCFFTGAWLYMIASRVLFGFTVGEWACDIRLGQPTERMHSTYLSKVMMRSTAIIFSGTVFLPLISLVLGKDLAGEISGVKIYSLK